MKKIFKILFVASIVLLIGFSATSVFAVDPVSSSDVGGQIPTEADPDAPFSTQLARVLNVLLALASTVAVLFIIIGGYTYLTSGGSQDQIGRAKKMIIGALVGLVIIILSFAAVNFIDNLIS